MLAHAEEDRRAGQEGRDDPLLGHGGEAFLVGAVEVIGRDGAQLGGEHGPAGVAQLVGVQLGPEVLALGGAQDLGRLLGGEDPLLAEHVAEARQATDGDAGDGLGAEPLDVGVGVLALGHRVGPHEGRHHVDGLVAVELVEHLELLELGVEVEAVAALGFNGGRAVGEHGRKVTLGLAVEGVEGGLAGLLDRRVDAAARRHDLGVGGAPGAQFELALAAAAEDQVGVRVDQTGGDDAAAGVHLGGVRVDRATGHDLVGGADGDDLAVGDRNRPVGDDREVALLVAAARAAAARDGDQLGRVADDQVRVEGGSVSHLRPPAWAGARPWPRRRRSLRDSPHPHGG
ncbi:N-formimino-L-glutamate deiminase [compost metagenome]